jgi:flagellar motor switch protein FliM
MKSPDPALIDELPVELSCRLAEITLSAREVLQLAPGAVVPLGRGPAGGVDLISAGRVVARGELVDVDGELGVRILEIPG